MARAQALAPLDRVLALRSYAPFGSVDAELLADVARQSREHRHRRGETILDAGDAGETLRLLVEGRALVTGREHDGEVVEPTAALAPITFFAHSGADAQARALDDALTLDVDRRTVDEALLDEPAVARAVIAHLAEASIAPLRARLRGAFIAIAPDAATGEVDPGWIARLRVLRQANLFESCSVEPLMDTARILEAFSAAAGAVLWREGEKADGALLMVSGRLTGAGELGVEFTGGAGFEAGLLESLCRAPRWYEARAETRIEGFRLRASDLFGLLERSPATALPLVARLARGVLEPEGGRAR